MSWMDSMQNATGRRLTMARPAGPTGPSMIEAPSSGMRTSIGSAAEEMLQGRLSGRQSPGLAAKFREMDEATGQAGADTLAQSRATTLAGAAQGSARRNVQTAMQGINQQIASNKLRQAQMLGEDQSSAMSQGLQVGQQARNESASYLDRLARNAADTGDTVTQASLNRIYAGRGGTEYTGAGEQRLDEQARQAAADEEAMRNSFDANARTRADMAKPNRGRNLLGGAASGAAAGSAFGPAGTVIGGLAGGLASLWS